MRRARDVAAVSARWPAVGAPIARGAALGFGCVFAAAIAMAGAPGCGGGSRAAGDRQGSAGSGGGGGGGGAAGAAVRASQAVQVLLDGEPVEGAKVMQGGAPRRWRTGPDGRATVEIDTTVEGAIYVMAAHPDARTNGAAWVGSGGGEMVVKLRRFSKIDNEAYVFGDPGEPGRRSSTSQCGHCHESQNDDWFASAHRRAASNPAVHDVYAGAAVARGDAAACAEVGGVLRAGIEPGTGAAAQRCYVGDGVLPALNPGCGQGDSGCDAAAKAFGRCADCHAPGLDGKLGGRDLLEARGVAYDAGVHCDVCHRVESIELGAAPGVAGRLRLLRPSEASPTPSLGEFWPLTFGPYDDVMTPKMGAVARAHFHEATLCAGCHPDEQPAMVPGQSLDPARWPGGRLPVQTTFAEWVEGPMNPAAPCQSCHMPPAPHEANSAGLEHLEVEPDSSTGWARPPGAVRRHTWAGPRSEGGKMLALAASLTVATRVEGGVFVVDVTTKNVGPGHAIPTGEPMRSLVLLVEARCGEQLLEAVGGDAVPSFGGYLERRTRDQGFATWSRAKPGHVVRVIARPGGHHDYTGHGPFGDGRFSAEQKGMPVEHVVGSATVISVEGGVVTFDRALPDGDVAYLGEAGPLASTSSPWAERPASLARAGAPGFAFARVLAAADGRQMVPHFAAVDVLSDNRLLPQRAWSTSHRFAATCDAPTARAVLVHRAYPLDLARERAWALVDSPMTEASK